MEESAELTQEISKTLRGREDNIGLLEELADNYLSLLIIRRVLNISLGDINKAINVKVDRLRETPSRFIK